MKKLLKTLTAAMICITMPLLVSCDKDSGFSGGNSGGGSIDGHEYVDLGLPSGLLWATCNIGAENPEEYGDYFSWGETAAKYDYSWNTYKWCDGSSSTLTKYNTDLAYGVVDDKTVLEPEDDAACVNWGSDWRMPTDEEWRELLKYTKSEWTTRNGVDGRLLTSIMLGHTSVSLFFPATGYYNGFSLILANSRGYCWSSSLWSSGHYASSMSFYSGNAVSGISYRNCGLTVRPVSDRLK